LSRTIVGSTTGVVVSPLIAWLVSVAFGAGTADGTSGAFGSAVYFFGITLALSWFWVPVVAAIAITSTIAGNRWSWLDRSLAAFALVVGLTGLLFSALVDQILTRQAAVTAGVVAGLAISAALLTARRNPS